MHKLLQMPTICWHERVKICWIIQSSINESIFPSLQSNQAKPSRLLKATAKPLPRSKSICVRTSGGRVYRSRTVHHRNWNNLGSFGTQNLKCCLSLKIWIKIFLGYHATLPLDRTGEFSHTNLTVKASSCTAWLDKISHRLSSCNK